MIEKFIRKYIYWIILLLVTIVHYKVLFSPFSYTFNFADNLGYAKLIELTRISFEIGTPFYIPKDTIFWWEDYKIFLITPLWQTLWALASYILPSIFFINVIIIWGLYLNILCSYKLFEYINKGNPIISFTWAVIFWSSSLVLYATWFNLIGLFFIPLCLLYFLKYIDYWKSHDLLLSLLFFIFLWLSSTYFLPLIAIVIAPFFISFIKKYFKKVITSIILFTICFIWIFLVYKIPFYYLDSYDKWVVIEDLLEERKITSSLDLFELFTPNNNNLFSKFQLNNIKDLSTSDNRYFRYSNYLPIPVLLLLALLITSKYYGNILNPNKEIFRRISIFIIIISILLFLWDRITIWKFDLWINNLLFYLKQLPNWEIIRKSAYFFFTLTFWISLIIVSSFSKKFTYENTILFVIFIPLIFLSSIWPYHWKVFWIHDKLDIITKIPSWALMLPLPNSWYNNWEFQYNILRTNPALRIVEVWNATLPDYTRNLELWTPYLNWLIYNSEFEIECDLWGDINYIVLYKQYIENFFFYSNESRIFKRDKENIENCPSILKIDENKEIILYKNLNAK